MIADIIWVMSRVNLVASAVKCLTGDRGLVGLSLTRSTALCSGARQFILCLVLVQTRKTHPNMTEKLLSGM